MKAQAILLSIVLLLLIAPVTAAGQMTFDDVEGRTNYGTAEEGDKGKLLVDGTSIRFVKKNEREEYFSIPSSSVTELFYSRVSGRRIKTAILISPLLLFSKGKKHYMTLSFNDGAGQAGAVDSGLTRITTAAF